MGSTLPLLPGASNARSTWPALAKLLEKIVKFFFGQYSVANQSTVQDETSDGKPSEDNPFSQYCADNAPIWKIYLEVAGQFDRNLADILNSNLDPLMLFAGLFSAVLAAFLIEAHKGLQQDPLSITNNLLAVMIEGQNNATTAGVLPSSTFVPTSASRWVNGLWFTSLMFSLLCALNASMAKSWVTQFSSTGYGSSWDDASVHCRRLRGLIRWRLQFVIEWLPIWIHSAFFLFSAGLAIFLFRDDPTIAKLMLVLTLLAATVYIANSLLSALHQDSPFRTPVSRSIHRLFSGKWHLHEFRGFPSDENAQRAQALSWLLIQSHSAHVVDTLQAIAGLPFTLSVQKELLLGAATSSILGLLSTEILKEDSDTDIMRASLYALLHLVQCRPTDTNDLASLKALTEPRGLLYDTRHLPVGVHEVALCIKGRVLLLCGDEYKDCLNNTMFRTEVPALGQACEDPDLRTALFELYLLSRPENDWITPIRSDMFQKRHSSSTGLAAFVQKNIQRDELMMAVAFDPTLLLKRVSGGSPELQRQFTSIFKELCNNVAFNRCMMAGEHAKTVCSFMYFKDARVRGNIKEGLLKLCTIDEGYILINDSVTNLTHELIDNELDVNISVDIAGLLAGLLKHDKLRPSIPISKIMFRILELAMNAELNEQFQLMNIYLDLANYEDICDDAPTVVTSLLKFIGKNLELDKKNMIWTKIVDLSHHVPAAITTPDARQKILSMLGSANTDVRAGTVKALRAFMDNDDIRPKFAAATDVIRSIVSMLSSDQSCAREGAIEAIALFLSRDDLRTNMEEQATVLKIFSMIGDSESNVRLHARKAVKNLAECDATRKILSEGSADQISSLIENQDPHIQASALKTILTFVEHKSILMKAITGDALKKIFQIAGDPTFDSALTDHDGAPLLPLLPLTPLRTVWRPHRMLSSLISDRWWLRELAHEVVCALAQHKHSKSLKSSIALS
ncbi:armadillo-type protein [Mycena galopus ATCC 62051]|nr:armadillo-type protein [Mycena galopus ATCC 62051]